MRADRGPYVCPANSAFTRVTAFAIMGMLALGVVARRGDAHPLHTTLTEVTLAPDGTVQIVLRAFVDDFSAVVAGRRDTLTPPIATPAAAAVAAYLAGAIVLTDSAGQRTALSVANVRRTDDLVWVMLRAPMKSVTGARLTNRVLFERYDDQVNIVQTALGGRKQTLLFTKRDANAAKPI